MKIAHAKDGYGFGKEGWEGKDTTDLSKEGYDW